MPLTDESRNEIFNKIKSSLQKCTPPMAISKDKAGTVYELIGNKPVPYGSKKVIVPGMYFSSVVSRKDMVSFYFFPIYVRDEFSDSIPTMIKYLKGKSCFNFKKPEQVVTKELDTMLKKGIAAWKKLGYMK